MELTQEQYQMLEEYLLEKLSPEEKTGFEIEIANNPALLKELSNLSALITMVELSSLQTKKRKSGKILTFWKKHKFISIAVVIPLFTALLFAFIFPVPNDLVSDYYIPDFEIPAQEKFTWSEEFKKTYDLYFYKKFDEAAVHFNELMDADPGNEHLKYYTASAYLASGKNEKARDIFLSVEENDYLKNKSLWFLALLDLKENKPEQAIPALEKISNHSGHPYREEATSLLRELKK